MLVDDLANQQVSAEELPSALHDAMPWVKVILRLQDPVSYLLSTVLKLTNEAEDNANNNNNENEQGDVVVENGLHRQENLSVLLNVFNAAGVTGMAASQSDMLLEWFETYPTTHMVVIQKENDVDVVRKQLQRFLTSEGLPQQIEKLVSAGKDERTWTMLGSDYKGLVAAVQHDAQRYGFQFFHSNVFQDKVAAVEI